MVKIQEELLGWFVLMVDELKLGEIFFLLSFSNYGGCDALRGEGELFQAVFQREMISTRLLDDNVLNILKMRFEIATGGVVKMAPWERFKGLPAKRK